jgi:acyl carrier protein
MRPDCMLEDHTRLLEERVIDSMGVMELITFIERTFGIRVPDKEITEANLGSVASISTYVRGKLESAAAA